ncbi:transmembrane protein [Mycobacterium tuberculosis]|nr:transmembrane protein [Mycobacterium tuberculosis]
MGGIAILIIMTQLDQVRSSSLLVLVTVVLLLASGRFIKAIPPSLLVLVLVSSVLPLAAPWLRDLRAGPVSINRTVDYIGEIPQAMPSFDFPHRRCCRCCCRRWPSRCWDPSIHC